MMRSTRGSDFIGATTTDNTSATSNTAARFATTNAGRADGCVAAVTMVHGTACSAWPTTQVPTASMPSRDQITRCGVWPPRGSAIAPTTTPARTFPVHGRSGKGEPP